MSDEDLLIGHKRIPRPYQIEAVSAAWEALRTVDSTVIVMPTGTGKTFVAAMLAEEARQHSSLCSPRTLFLAHREHLINQAEDTLRGHGLDLLVEMANQNARKNAAVTGEPEVVVGTVQTLQGDRLNAWPDNYFGLIISDECHHSAAQTYQNVYKKFSSARHVGITATLDGSSGLLGKVFQTKCYEYPFKRAINEGYLVYPRQKCMPITVDLRDISTIGGDFNIGELAERISPHVEELADATREAIGDRYAVAFTPDVGSAMALAQALTGLGVEARYVAGTAGRFGVAKAERKELLKQFNHAAFQVIVCCDLLFEGWDCPHISAVVVARPTRLRYRYVQMAGRGTRPCPEVGKDDLIIVDFDWKTTGHARDLCAVIDLYGSGDEQDEETQEVFNRAKKKSDEKAKTGEVVDPEEMLEEARHYVQQQKLRIRLTGRKAKYHWAPTEFTPSGVAKLAGIKLTKYDVKYDRAGSASPAQLAYLKTLGVNKPGEISKWGAAKLITALKKRRSGGLATPDQIDALGGSGMAMDIARTLKSKEADQVLRNLLHQTELFGHT